MKKVIIFFGLISTLIFTSCIDKTPLTAEQIQYAGTWVTNDGTWIQILNDGTGGLKTGNASVEGGKATITNKQIEIGLFGINKVYQIEKPPYEENGTMKMQLSGYVYEKQNQMKQ